MTSLYKCNAIFSRIMSITSNINYYDIRKKCEGNLCYDFSNVETFLNEKTVTDALGVRNLDFVSCSSTVYDAMMQDWMRNIEVGIPALLEDGIQVLVYAGEEDLICNWLDAMSKMITENASEEFLHALSNYCALQGFVEDQFGLGLIARAVEEGISVIKAAGIMIFNMGGRPGQAVCKRLFERRGFCITKLWQTKILQAGDTDIAALVEIEKNSPHRFEFFMGLSGDQPICARTAWAYGKAGGRISHALSVYSCQLRNPTQIKVIFEFLKNGFQGISSSLDLSFEDDSVADEKIPFLAYLASTLKNSSYFPYEPPAGSKRFRNLIAGFLKTYHHISDAS